MRRIVLFAAGVIAAVGVAGCAGQLSAARNGSVQACAAYAYRAIQEHEVVAGVPAACGGLSRAQVNQAASIAIRQAAGSGPKSLWRAQTSLAQPWVAALLTGPVPVREAPGVGAGGSPSGSQLGGGSEMAVEIAALLAWLMTAASGGYVLVRWWRAGGRLRRRTDTTVPPVVMLAHAGLGLLGLVLWTVFAATGWAALAWVSVGLLAPVAGLGMAVLVIGLPSPRRMAAPAEPAAAPVGLADGPGALPAAGGGTAVLVAPAAPAAPARPRGRQPVLVIALHGLFAATALLLVITAAVGAV